MIDNYCQIVAKHAGNTAKDEQKISADISARPFRVRSKKVSSILITKNEL